MQMPESQKTLLFIHMKKIIGLVRQGEQQRQVSGALQTLQGALAGGGGGQPTGGGPVPGTATNPMVQGGELLDESLPSAGGGGNV